MNKSIIVVSLLCLSGTAWSESPVGLWRTVSDKTGKSEAIVEIWVDDGELRGKTVHLIDPEQPDPLCTLCEGEHKDQPVLGMTILWGLSQSGAEWKDGKILDPNNGQVYSANLKVNSRGELELRGFVGFALLGRTQTWYRAEQYQE